MKNKRALFTIFMILFVDFTAMSMIFPLLPFYSQKFGASPVFIGLLTSTFALFQLIASPFLGSVSDNYGRKKVLLFSQVGTCIALGVLARGHALWVIFLARALGGFSAGNISVAQAYIADTVESHERTKAFGFLGVSFGLGLMSGSLIAGFLSEYKLEYPIYGAQLLTVMSIVLTTLFLSEQRQAYSDPHTKKRKLDLNHLRFFRDPILRPLFIEFAIFVIAFSYFLGGFPLFAQSSLKTSSGAPFGAHSIGYLYAYLGLLGILYQGVCLGPLSRRFGERRLVRFGFIAAGLGYALFSGIQVGWGVVFASTLFAFGNSMLRPNLTSLISQNVDERHQGGVLGLTASINSMAQILAPPLGNLFLEHSGPTLWPLFLGMIYFSGLGVSVFRKKPHA